MARSSKKTETVPYDVAEQLRTPEEMAAYLDAWLTEAPDDVAGIARALGDIARTRGMTQVARDAGLSRESLYRSLSEDETLADLKQLQMRSVANKRLTGALAPRGTRIRGLAQRPSRYLLHGGRKRDTAGLKDFARKTSGLRPETEMSSR